MECWLTSTPWKNSEGMKYHWRIQCIDLSTARYDICFSYNSCVKFPWHCFIQVAEIPVDENQPKDKRVGKYGIKVIPKNAQGGPKELLLRLKYAASRAEWIRILQGGASGEVVLKKKKELNSVESTAMHLFGQQDEEWLLVLRTHAHLLLLTRFVITYF